MRKVLTNKFTIIFIIILAIALPVTIWQTQRSQDVRQRASGTTTILTTLNPTSGSFTTGTPFSADLSLTSTNDVGSIQFTVNYDPAKLSLIGITPQSPYSLASETATPNSKTVTFLNITPNKVIGQNVKVATIQFSPLSAGNAEVNVNNVTFTVSGGTATLDPQSQLNGNYTITGVGVSPPPTATPTTPIATPTSTVQSGDTTLKLTFTLSGIGRSATSSQQLNDNPVRTTRTGDIIVYDRALHVIDTYPFTARYNPEEGTYTTIAQLGDLPTGSYLIKFRLDNTLFKFVPGISEIIAGSDNSYPGTIELISGDVVRTGTSDNVIDIHDYTAVNNCFNATVSDVRTQSIGSKCGLQTALKSDFNDDDVIDLKDYNILLRAFTKRVGD